MNRRFCRVRPGIPTDDLEKQQIMSFSPETNSPVAQLHFIYEMSYGPMYAVQLSAKRAPFLLCGSQIFAIKAEGYPISILELLQNRTNRKFTCITTQC